MSIVRVIARPMLASSFILSGIDRLRHADQTAEQLSGVLSRVSDALPVAASEKTLARVVAGTQIGAGVLLASGKFSRGAAMLLTLTTGLSTFVEYRSADSLSKEAKSHRRSQLIKNVSLLGGALLASVDTAGKPGLGWQAEHLIKSGKKSTKKQLKKADSGIRALAQDVKGH